MTRLIFIDPRPRRPPEPYADTVALGSSNVTQLPFGGAKRSPNVTAHDNHH